MTASPLVPPELRFPVVAYFNSRRVILFGSHARGLAGPDSDIDILVEFEPDFRVGYLRMAAMERELSALFGGRTIDLRTAPELSRYFRDDILKTASVQYAAQ